MRRHLPIVAVLAFVAVWTMNSFAQFTSDPRKMSVYKPQDGTFYQVPPGADNYQNPNHESKIYVFRDQVVDVYPNFRVHPSTLAQSEVPITRGLDPNILFASANVYRPSPFLITEGIYVSTDGGNTWFGSDTCTSAPINDHLGDPGPGVGPDGTLYMSFLGYSGGMKVAYSNDFGNTWSPSIILQSGSVDKNLTAVDNVPGSPYLGNAYVVWSDFNQSNPSATASYSTDGGVTWSTYQHINSSATGHYTQGVNPAVGPGGVVYVAWQSPVSGSPFTGDFVGLGKSTDGGASWTYDNNIYDCNGIRGTLTFAGASGIRVNDFPALAVDNSGGPRNGWLYIVTAERNLAPAGSDPDIVMHYSSDGGTTWSDGIRVNQDAMNNGQFQYMPAVCVGEDGAVNVVYYDTRNYTGGGSPDSAEVYLSRSVDGGATFIDIPVSDHKFKPKPIAGLAGGYQGDYIGVTESNGNVYPYWADDISGVYQAWTAQVSFGPPCEVENASNPDPASGATDVDINLSQLSWTNGAGAVTNELYFGTSPTNLTLVQSGSLSTSWTIDPSYLPLDYYTNYYWKVVELGDTCNSSIIFGFKTIQDPNFHMVSDTLYPQSLDYWTGTTDGSTKTDISEVRTADPEVGWMAFDISSIPSQATVTGVSFNGYVNDTNWPYWSITPMPDNPVTSSASIVYNDVMAGYDQGVAYLYSDESSSYTTGWHTYLLESNAVSDLQDAVTGSQGWFGTGIVDRDFSTTYYINFDGWNEANPPYIVVDYYYVTPVELSSFTASTDNGTVNLNWSTATETNNKGFEIERKSVNGEYQKVGYVAGFGTTTEPKSYTFTDNKVEGGQYTYRLRQVDLNGSSSYSKEVEVEVTVPKVFSLAQNYPNPFNPTTLIQYSIPAEQHVKLNVYNLLGEKVMTLVDGIQKSGQHEVNFNASNLASGVYIYKLEAGTQSSIKKMVLMK